MSNNLLMAKSYIIGLVTISVIAPVINFIMTFNKEWEGRLQALNLPLDSVYCQKEGIQFYEKGCVTRHAEDRQECDKLQIEFIKCQK